MIARKKSYDSIARSFRSKASLLIYLFFFLRMGDKLKNCKQERDIPAEYFHNNRPDPIFPIKMENAGNNNINIQLLNHRIS